ncbi:MAG: inositol monophosphatase [Elusimicrobia bacterium HGW-Elusimicrobia-2]|nr:MAG: inositol monophosphatase [Elusimicrobia bacterium HGW-Elusimicrobia-2]
MPLQRKNNAGSILKKAVAAARKAGRAALSMQKNISVEYKGAINPVTDADKKSERILIDELSKLGDFGFLCEENTVKKLSGTMWVIDPIDGTVNYAHGDPTWAVNIALVKNGDPVLGITLNPPTGDIFWALKGKGAFLNGKNIRVSAVKKTARALLSTGFPYDVWEKPDKVLRIFRKFLVVSQGIRRPGSAALDMAYTACGRFDGFWEQNLYPWDIAAGAILIEEAGGRVTDYKNAKIKCDETYIRKNRSILASNGLLHKKMLSLIGEKK